ncbi:MAG: protein kinase [Deltaproteobacteria bacterium]|jgi:hypothetical protein|nr:protein kinase [Deltaproteobacteria bacterium]
MRVLNALPASGAEADLFIVMAPEGRRVLRLSRCRAGLRPEVADSLDRIASGLGDGAVRVYSRGFDDFTGREYEIQEYLPLGDLASLIARRRLSQAEILRLADSVSATLDSLHRGGIIHRDLKPANILIRGLDPFRIALCDFGIASVLAPDVSVKSTRAANTPLYSAPESFADFAGEAGDFWSLGAVLLECAAGAHPLAGLPVNLVMREICTRGLPVPEGLPPAVETLIRGLLSRDDRSRWRRAQIREFLEGGRPALPTDAPVAGSCLQAALPPEAPLPPAAPEAPHGRPGAPFRCIGSEYLNLSALAERFNRDTVGWEAGAALMARGSIASWLRSSGRIADAETLEREARGTPHEALFAFVRIFAPQSPPAFRGVNLTLDNLVTLLKSADSHPSGGRGVLEAVLDGTLKGFPRIAAAFGNPLEETMELILEAGGGLDAATLACALAALQDPDAFIWGASGPPRGLKAAAFVLKAGCPLLENDWWARNVPPGFPFPQNLLDGPLNRPETYAEGASEARRKAAAGEYAYRRALAPLFASEEEAGERPKLSPSPRGPRRRQP